MSLSSRPRVRPGLVWLVVTGVAAALAQVTVPALTGPTAGSGFAGVLVVGCAAAALAAAGWLWAVTTSVVVDVLRDPAGTRSGAGALRRLVLAACGVAVLAGTAAPAGAASRPVSPLDGLPMPDRAVGAATTGQRVVVHDVAGPGRPVQVRPGDSLWSIAARTLGPGASAAEVAAYWPRIRARNAAVIGDDPDLIRPHQRLHLPPTHQE